MRDRGVLECGMRVPPERGPNRCPRASGTPAFPMPTVLRVGPYRFYFHSGDRVEPPHVHIGRDDNEAKFWIQPVRLHHNDGFRSAELRRDAEIVEENDEQLLEAWNGYFGE